MNFHKKISLFVSTIVVVVTLVAISVLSMSFAHIALAQMPTSITGVDISSEPATPQPGESVTVQVKSYITDLNGAKIIWYENQKAMTGASGTGKTAYTFTAPKNGTKLIIAAQITTLEGKEVQKLVSIRSNSIDLVIETGGYTPPFYQGKATPAYQNTINFIAVPHFIGSSGTEIDPKKLIYKWRKNSTVLQDQSGYGKQSVSITSAVVPRPYTVAVEVSSLDEKITGEANIYFDDSSEPSVLLYEEDPLYGVLFNNVITQNFRMRHSELSVLAAPFSFNTSENAATSYVWSVNGSERPDLGNKRGITLRVKSGADGNSNVSLDIRNQQSILQGASTNFNAYFSSKNTSGSLDSSGNYTNPF